jgi:DNA-binding response OmpR family regulator
MVRRALVVEDEILVAMYVEDLLTELGYGVVAIATELDEALPVARREAFELAVLDVNLNGKLSFPIADVLRERKIPFLFASGYGSKGLADGYKGAVHIQKPFVIGDLEAAIARAGAGRRDRER